MQASDEKTTLTVMKLHESLLLMNSYSAASQLNECSYSKFEIQPFISKESSTEIDNSIETITINKKSNGIDHEEVCDEALLKIFEKYGNNIMNYADLLISRYKNRR